MANHEKSFNQLKMGYVLADRLAEAKPRGGKQQKKEGTMQTACEQLNRCRYFRNFRYDSDARYKIWVKIFCESGEKAKDCARRKHMEDTGRTAPNNMTPTGRLL